MSDIVIPYKPRQQFTDYHNRKERWAIIVAHRRYGKALCVKTPIPMADGSFKTMGSLKAGDFVLGSNGHPCKVVVAHGVLIGRKCFLVKFSDGEEIICDEEHLWKTDTKLDRSYHTGTRKGPRGEAKYITRTHAQRKGSVKTTKEIKDTLIYGKERNHSIDLCGQAQYPQNDNLQIDPYILGLWLGDGSSGSPHFTTMDAEIVASLNDYAKLNNYSLKTLSSTSGGKAKTYSVTGERTRGLTAKLKQINVFGNKHIPEVYMRSGVQQRIDLIRGLMDTDGSILPFNSCCEITQKNRTIADGILRVLLSLGEMPTMGVKKINGTDYFRISFRSAFNPFKLGRKADLWNPPKKNSFSRKRYIISIDEVESRPVRCITVDSNDNLYLAGTGFIPTHNTLGCVNDLIKAAVECPLTEPRFAYIAPTYAQAKDVVWGYLKHFSHFIPNTVSNESELHVTLANGARIRLYGSDNYDRMRGIYLDGVVNDEYGDQDPRAWTEVIRPALSDRQGWGTFIGTPRGANHFKEVWDKAQDDPKWFKRIIKASQTGLLAEDELQDARTHMTAEQYAAEYECSFSGSLMGAYFAIEMEALEIQGRIAGDFWRPEYTVHTAWDVGGTTAIWFFQCVDGEVFVIDYLEANNQSAAWYADKLRAKPYNYGKHIMPSDAGDPKEVVAHSWVDAMAKLDITNIHLLPKQRSIDDGINACKLLLPRCRFSKDKTKDGRASLVNYKQKWDEKRKTFTGHEDHDWSSHGAAGFRYLAVGLDAVSEARVAWSKPIQYKAGRLV